MTDLKAYQDADKLLDYMIGWRAARDRRPMDLGKTDDWKLGYRDYVISTSESETSETLSGTTCRGGGLSAS